MYENDISLVWKNNYLLKTLTYTVTYKCTEVGFV